MSVYYLKVKRERIGQCNICKQISELTWDHVPPKGGVSLTQVEQISIMTFMTGNRENTKPEYSQNGVKYRSICRKCNNELLGSNLDPELNRFSLGVGNYLNTQLQLPPMVNYKAKPGKLVRAILGHLLASNGEFTDSKIDGKFRQFLFDMTAMPPKDLRVFYWVYPYSSIITLRDVGMPAIRGDFSGGIGIFSLLKYFPLAFLVTNLNSYEGLSELTKYCTDNPEEEAEIPINLQDVRDETWPEMGDNNFLLGGQSLQGGLYAKPRKMRK